jgi:hypothetical protein
MVLTLLVVCFAMIHMSLGLPGTLLIYWQYLLLEECLVFLIPLSGQDLIIGVPLTWLSVCSAFYSTMVHS